MVGNELPVSCLGQHLSTLAPAADILTGSGELHLVEKTTRVSQTTPKDQGRDHPLSQEPPIRGSVSSCGGLQAEESSADCFL